MAPRNKTRKRSDLHTQIGKIFNQGQKTIAAHRKCVLSLKRLQRNDEESFFDHFFTQIQRIMTISKKEPCVERIIQLVVEFLQFENNEFPFDENFVLLFLHALVEHANASEKAVRIRICQFLAHIINNMGDIEIDEELWEELCQTLIYRMRDKAPQVRSEAISAAVRFQDLEDDENDVIVNEYLRIMSADSNKDVRKNVLGRVVGTNYTIPYILERIRDEKEEVRITAFKMLSQIKISNLSISQRAKVMTDGLNDRSENVCQLAKELLCTHWLSQVDSNILQLLAKFDVEHFESVAVQIIKTLQQELGNFQVDIPFDSLSSEATLYWRIKCESLKKNKDEESLEKILPDTAEFCELIIHYQTEEFICRQLLLIAAEYLDVSDEAGRKSLRALLGQMLITFREPEVFVPELVKCLAKVAENKVDMYQCGLNAVAELHDAAKEAAVTDLEIDEETADIGDTIWMRCLVIAHELLSQKIVNVEQGGILKIIDILVKPTLNHSNVFVRKTSLAVLGQLSAVHKPTAQTYLPYLSNTLYHCLYQDEQPDPSEEEEEGEEEENPYEIATATIKSIFDILLVHHPQSFDQQNTAILEYLLDPNFDIESQDSAQNDMNYGDIITIVVEGFAKLFICKKYENPDILSKMMLLLFSPATISQSRLRQCLSVFFPAFAFTFLDHMKLTCTAGMSAIHQVLSATQNTVLETIPIKDLAPFVVYLSDIYNLQENHRPDPKEIWKESMHENIGLAMAEEVVANANAPHAKVFLRMFNSLRLHSENTEILLELKQNCEKMQTLVKHKLLLKALDNFHTSVNKMCPDQTPQCNNEVVYDSPEESSSSTESLSDKNSNSNENHYNLEAPNTAFSSSTHLHSKRDRSTTKARSRTRSRIQKKKPNNLNQEKKASYTNSRNSVTQQSNRRAVYNARRNGDFLGDESDSSNDSDERHPAHNAQDNDRLLLSDEEDQTPTSSYSASQERQRNSNHIREEIDMLLSSDEEEEDNSKPNRYSTVSELQNHIDELLSDEE